MTFDLIATLGPSLLDDPGRLRTLDALGSCIYRINGAHATATQASVTAATARAILPEARLMIDLPGNKIRTNQLESSIRLARDAIFALRPDQLNYPAFHTHLTVGDTIYANDSTYRFEVVEIEPGGLVRFRSHSDGLLQSNKGFHLRGLNAGLPFLFPRDLELIEMAKRDRFAFVSLSFVRTADDVLEARRQVGEGPDVPEIIAKIETAAAVDNVESILRLVRRANVDRGDLSSEIGMLALPEVQAKVIRRAHEAGVKLYLATQFLKNMEDKPVPLIAEVMDLQTSLRSGISGIQLSEETAVGAYPIECARLVFDCVAEARKGDR